MRGFVSLVTQLLWLAVVGSDSSGKKNIDQTVLNADVARVNSSTMDEQKHKLRGTGTNGEVETKNNSGDGAHDRIMDDVFKPGCVKACDSCFADHMMYCYAQCFKGCQQYCKTVDTLPGCSEREMWSATPGSAPEMSSSYRVCASDTFDGCPSAYLFD